MLDHEGADWTAGDVRAELATLAGIARVTADELLEKATNAEHTSLLVLLFRQRRARAGVDRARSGNLLPAAPRLEKVQRYEAHVERSLYRGLHELERLQARRAGTLVPAPATLDVAVSLGADADRGPR